MDIFSETRQVIKEIINDSDISAYIVGYDIDNDGNYIYRLSNLISVLTEAIPEFAFGVYGNLIPENSVRAVKDAAKSIYKIDSFNKIKNLCDENKCLTDDIGDKYLRRGEFGELILHVILRSYKGTIPLLSKIYFKDSYGTAVHGFDAVHVHEGSKSLWLAESKIYQDGKTGVKKLIEDLHNHLNIDYLHDEFSIISKKIELFGDEDIPERKYWLDLLSRNVRLMDILNHITIPLLCTYESTLLTKGSDSDDLQLIENIISEIYELKRFFDANNHHPLKQHVNIILLLFPIKSKLDLVKGLHTNLFHIQRII